MKAITVNLPQNNDIITYPIIWENNYDELKKLIKDKTKDGKHFLVTNNTLSKLYADEITELFEQCNKLTPINDGESYKNFTTVASLADEMLQKGANRSSTLWAFGGGVVGDITGFLASVYMRGVQFYQVPTTLLSMVDSSVGGKTGVNLNHGKNMIGTFFQPRGVFIHVNFLRTLGAREFKSGLSEVVKSALLADLELFQYLEDHIGQVNEHLTKIKVNEDLSTQIEVRKSLIINETLMEELSFRSVQIKANVVMQDEKETGLRAILNLGHTLAHAVESSSGYAGPTHGAAVSEGITYAAYLSLKRKYINDDEFFRIISLINNLHLKDEWYALSKRAKSDLPPDMDHLITLMKGDKKNIDESIRFILLEGIGKCRLPEPVDIKTIRETLVEFIKL